VNRSRVQQTLAPEIDHARRSLSSAVLLEMAIRRGEGALADNGALVVSTAPHTGRAPKDRFIVADPSIKDQINWGQINLPLDPAAFSRIAEKARTYLQNREIFVFDGWACSDPGHRLKVRVITELAWQALFARCLLIRPPAAEVATFSPDCTVLVAAGMHLTPSEDGTNSDIVIALSMEQKLVVIAGTHYAGEIKKSVFSLLNFLLPQRGVLPMHCSANIGPSGDTALFFGLSGTGKTTLSADPQRQLIGDDEHGWSDEGIFNFEGGCYAKCIKLSQEAEPEIYAASKRFGAVLENVVLDEHTRVPDFDDGSKTENTRSAYPLDFIPNASRTGRAGHPKNVVMLAADAFGVLPPIAKLTPAQAMYHFLSGYTAKVAGTERGLGSEPQPEFSTCFGSPFLPLDPSVYGNMLRELIARHNVDCWLVNTGWTGGKYGTGSRMPIKVTRALLTAALDGSLRNVEFRTDRYFGFAVPTALPGVPTEILNPVNTWKDRAEFDKTARALVGMFQKNFAKFEAKVDAEVRAAAPEVKLAAE
jgi:phosphoenolpyruvate carboxykinase (ATP)